jgi:hypothetical protein
MRLATGDFMEKTNVQIRVPLKINRAIALVAAMHERRRHDIYTELICDAVLRKFKDISEVRSLLTDYCIDIGKVDDNGNAELETKTEA